MFLAVTLLLLPLAAAPAPTVISDAGTLDAPIPDESTQTAPPSEVDEMRALEESALDPTSSAEASLRSNLNRLGLSNVLHDRLWLALDEAESSGEQFPLELGPITDLSTFDVSKIKNAYDIPIEMQPLVAEYIHFFQGAGRKWFRNWMSRSTRFIPLMQPILEANGVPKDLVYLSMIESGFSPQAYSWARAAGPWQFISATGKLFGLKQDFFVDERRDPIKSTKAAAHFLRNLHDEFGHWYLAWAGYNAGGGRVRRAIEKVKTDDFWQLAEAKAFAKETQHYVPKLIACAIVAKNPEAFGFVNEEFDWQGPFEYDEYSLTDSVDLEVIAKSAGITIDDVRALNPELVRWSTPPCTREHPYTIRLPRGRHDSFAAVYQKLAPAERLSYRFHKVQRGDTLSLIASRYRSIPEAIMRMNNLKSTRYLRLGTDLLIPIPMLATASAENSAVERQAVRARRTGMVARPQEEIPAGTMAKTSTAVGGTIAIETVDGKKKVTYGVASGDSLWTISRRFDVNITDLKAWNPGLGKTRRGLRVGTAVLIWPGPNADLSKPTPATAVATASTRPTSDGGTLIASTTPNSTATIKPPGSPVPESYRVGRGDSLWSIARKFDIHVEELEAWNGLTDKKLKLGQELKLRNPGSTAP